MRLPWLLWLQAFAESGGGEGVEDEDLVTQLRYKRTMLGDLIAAKDVQVRCLGPLLASCSL
jgi:hypothetical protein